MAQADPPDRICPHCHMPHVELASMPRITDDTTLGYQAVCMTVGCEMAAPWASTKAEAWELWDSIGLRSPGHAVVTLSAADVTMLNAITRADVANMPGATGWRNRVYALVRRLATAEVSTSLPESQSPGGSDASEQP